jgi:Na+/H+ antiporter NhaB
MMIMLILCILLFDLIVFLLYLGVILIAINLCVAFLFGYYEINDAMKEIYEIDEENDNNDDNHYNTVDHKGDLLLG